MKKPAHIIAVHDAGPDHQVVTVKGGSGGLYRREPCEECPWRRENAGNFPPEAFRHSARTAYDMASHTFACHMSGAEKPAICAGFILRGATHNMAMRLKWLRGECQDVKSGDAELFDSYREMAEANGVEADDPALRPCRD